MGIKRPSSVAGQSAKCSSLADVQFEQGPGLSSSQRVRISQRAVNIVLDAGDIDECRRTDTKRWLQWIVAQYFDCSEGQHPTSAQRRKEATAIIKAATEFEDLLRGSWTLKAMIGHEYVKNPPSPNDLDDLADLKAWCAAEDRIEAEIAAVTTLRQRAAYVRKHLSTLSPEQEHAAVHKSTDPALTFLSQFIEIFWTRRLGREPRISETSLYVHFAKEVFALVGKDSTSFDTIKTRLQIARKKNKALPR